MELVKKHKNSLIKQNVGMKKNWYDTKKQEKYDNRQFNQKNIWGYAIIVWGLDSSPLIVLHPSPPIIHMLQLSVAELAE